MSLVQLRTSAAPPAEGAAAEDERRFGAAASGCTGSLIDRQARTVRYLRLSLTDRCNYRCTYCMPNEFSPSPKSDVLSLEEVVALCTAFAASGVERVRLTGGEPTLRRGLASLVARLSQIQTATGESLEVVMTTNAQRLEGLAAPLKDAGLRGLTVSLDSLDAGRFREITRRGDLSCVLAGLFAARDAGFSAIKVNTVAIAGFNDDEIGAIARFCWSHGFVPRFIEMMPMASGALFVPGELMSSAAVRETIAKDVAASVAADEGVGIRGAGPARYFRVVGGPWSGARFGTIGAMTENFCASCNRLRLSATGQLHGCLAYDDAADLRGALRSGVDGALERAVQRVLGTKRDGHGFGLAGNGGPQKAMISIGG